MPFASFLRRLFIFLLPIALVGISLEGLLRSFPNSYRTKAEAISEHADSVESIILGNSHAYYAVRPDLLSDAAVNLANVSQTLAIDREILETYAPRCSRLKTIYLVCDHSNLFDPPLDCGEEAFRITYYHIYMGLCRPSWTRYLDWELWHTTAAIAKLKTLMDPSALDEPCLGEQGESLPLRRAGKHTCRDWSLAEANAAELRNIAAYCQAHHLRLIVLSTPVTASYLQFIPSRQKAYLQELMNHIGQAYGTSFWDYSADARFCDDDFLDADHLSPSGATHFMLLLKQRFHECADHSITSE